MGVHPATLDLRQGVERVPQVIEKLHPLQKLLRRGLMQAGRVFDPIVTVERILCPVTGDAPLVGGMKPLGRTKSHCLDYTYILYLRSQTVPEGDLRFF